MNTLTPEDRARLRDLAHRMLETPVRGAASTALAEGVTALLDDLDEAEAERDQARGFAELWKGGFAELWKERARGHIEAERDAAREVMDRHRCDEQAESAHPRALYVEAARAEVLSDRQYGKVRDERDRKLMVGALIIGAEWDREQALTQEPTDAEVEAARKAKDDHLIVTKHYRDGEIYWEGCDTCHQEIRDYAEQERHEIRAALSAAHAARLAEELPDPASRA